MVDLAPGTTVRVRTPQPSVTPVHQTRGEKGDPGAPGGSDASFAAFVSDPASATRAQLTATYARVFGVDATTYGGGSVDATAHIQGKIDAARDAGGGIVYLPPGTYSVSPLTLYANVTLAGAGRHATVLVMRSPTTQTWMSVSGGSLGSAVALTADAPAESTSLTITSTTGISAGDWLLLGDNTVTEAAYPTRLAGELVQVDAVTSGTVLSLRHPTCDAYTVAQTGGVQKVTTVPGVRLQDLQLRNPLPATNTASGVNLSFCLGAQVEDCRFQGLDNPALTLELSADCTVTRCTFENQADDDAASRFGYGVNLNGGVTAIEVSDCRFLKVRHGVTTNGSDGRRGVPTNILVANCQAVGCTHAAFDTHRAGVNITFQGCAVRGSTSSAAVGWQVRAHRVSILSCRATDMPSAAIYSVGSPKYLRVKGCDLTRVVGTGMQLDGDLTGLVVEGNTISDCSQHGIQVPSTASGSNLVIAGNVIRNVATSGNYAGIALSAGTTARVERNTVVSSYYGIQLTSGATTAFVDSNLGSSLGQVPMVTDTGTSTRKFRNFNLDFPSDRQTLSTSGAVTIDATKGDPHYVTLAANATSSTITGAVDGQVITIVWVQDATGGRTYAWPSACRFAGAAAPAGSTTAGRRDIVAFRYDSSSGLFLEESRSIGVG